MKGDAMNPTQWQTSLAPIISFFAGLLAARVPFLDAGGWGQVLGGIMGLVATIWGGVAAKQSSLVSTVASMPEVKEVKLEQFAPQALVNPSMASHVTK